MKWFWRTVVVSTAVGLSIVLWAFFIEPNRLLVHKSQIEISGLPPLRIAVISDLHAGAPFIDRAKIERIVRETNETKPTLTLLLGDYMIGHRGGAGVPGGTRMEPEEIGALLAPLRAQLGVFAVLGNHDWWTDGPRMRRALEANHIRVLDEEVARIDAPGASFFLAGIGDAMEGQPRPQLIAERVADGAPILAFTHSPDVFPDVPTRVALTIAGHTHGGQVRLPFLGPLVIPSRFGTRYAAGLVHENGHALFVSTGIGTSILPVRFGVPPEIAILEVHAGL